VVELVANIDASLVPAVTGVRVAFRQFGHDADTKIRGKYGGTHGGRDRD
jgi:hypothetical protein